MGTPKVFKPFLTITLLICCAQSGHALMDDAALNQGSPLKLTGRDQRHSQKGYVTAAKDPAKKLWFLTTNIWAIQSAEGQAVMSYTGRGEIAIAVNLKNIEGTFGGYPAVIYGRSPWSKTVASDQGVKFPCPLRQIKALTADISYNLDYEQLAGNIAYDLWLTNDPAPADPTNGVEVMIWLWDRKTGPLGNYERSETKRITVNGAARDAKFLVYIASRDKNRKFDVVSFVIDRYSTIQSGRVDLDLLDFVKTALSLARRDDELYLQGVEYGIEFTNRDQDFQLKIDRFQIDQETE